MSLWLKIVIGIWLYLSAGFGVLLLCQLIAKKVENSDDYYVWAYDVHLDPDEDDFGTTALGMIFAWPFVLLCGLSVLFEVQLKKILRKIWEELDKK